MEKKNKWLGTTNTSSRLLQSPRLLTQELGQQQPRHHATATQSPNLTTSANLTTSTNRPFHRSSSTSSNNNTASAATFSSHLSNNHLSHSSLSTTRLSTTTATTAARTTTRSNLPQLNVGLRSNTQARHILGTINSTSTSTSTSKSFGRGAAGVEERTPELATEIPLLQWEDAEFAAWKREQAREAAKLSQAMPSLRAQHRRAVDDLKLEFLNAVAASLVNQPKLREHDDPTRLHLLALAERMLEVDPEFILKIALYSRQHLNIRTTSNFLLALAASFPASRSHLWMYFGDAVRLPSDWLEVAELVTSLHNVSRATRALHFGSLPTALRKAMAAKFSDFDEYQLAKYNKGGKPKQQQQKQKLQHPALPKLQKLRSTRSSGSGSDSDSDSDSEGESESEGGAVARVASNRSDNEEELEAMSFSMKQLIRKIHVVEPAYPIMCILGKKYPASEEEFLRVGLPGTWDESMAGKRMRLQVPETWETQVSSRGNVAEVWQDLLDHNKLPFMAMLRNLRNLILAGVSEHHHSMVLDKLTSPGAVAASRQFPFRFFSAFQVMHDLEHPQEVAQRLAQRNNNKSNNNNNNSKQKKRAGPPAPTHEVTPELLALTQRYRDALDVAVKLATQYNVTPIRGTTVVFVQADADLDRPCTSARGLGKPVTMLEVAILMALMCVKAAEECVVVVHASCFPPFVLDFGSDREFGILSKTKEVMALVCRLRGYEHSAEVRNMYLEEHTKHAHAGDGAAADSGRDERSVVQRLLCSWATVAGVESVQNEMLFHLAAHGVRLDNVLAFGSLKLSQPAISW